MSIELQHKEVKSSIPFHMDGDEKRSIFITGGTGYIGSRLIKKLLLKDYNVIALVRKGSEHKIPKGATAIVCNPFDANTFSEQIPTGSIFIQLLGVPHPSPKKANLFREVDLKSVKASADAAAKAKVSHFIYMSVAMTPGKIMKAYQDTRSEGEAYCLSKHLQCTFIRPWYVIGPGHWWPILFLPFYGLAELIPAWKQKARSMALVTIDQVLRALLHAVNENPSPVTILEIKNIREKDSKGSPAVEAHALAQLRS